MAARSGPPLAVGYGKGEMYMGSDAIALSPFTNQISYLQDGRLGDPEQEWRRNHGLRRQPVERRSRFRQRRLMSSTKAITATSWKKEIYEQRKSFPMRSANYIDFATAKVRDVTGCDRFLRDRPTGNFGLWHGLSGRPRLQILVRTAGASAGRNRCGLRIPLSRIAAVEDWRGPVHLAVRRDGRHARLAALLQAGRPEDRRGRVCEGIHNRPRIRRVFPFLAGPEIGRCLDQGLHTAS